MSSKKDSGNQNPKSKSGKQLSKNKGEKNNREVSQSQIDSSQQSGDKNKEESKNPDSQSFKTDSLSLAVKDIEKNLAKEKASSSEKSKNNEKERASSMPQTSSTDTGESSSADGQKEAKPSLEIDGRASPFELSTIVEEPEVTEQDMEMLKCDSQQTGQGQLEKESKISGAMVGDKAENQPKPSGLKTAAQDQAVLSTAGAAAQDQAVLSTAGAAAQDQAVLSTAGAAAQDQAGFAGSTGSGTELPEEPGEQPRLSDMKRYAIFGLYPFLPNNIAMTSQNPFNEAIESLCDGDIIHAILCFEAFLKPLPPYLSADITPNEKRAWLCLGITQATIHQDILAIIALKTYLHYEPNNLDALIFLSLSYLYENYNNLTLITLWEWLSRNPKYSDLVQTSLPEYFDDVTLPFNQSFLRDLLHLFKQAATRVPPNEVDFDLQCCLGLLYNLKKKYRRASICFKAALLMNPHDETMWYHLGESLINNEKYDEAMDAYNLALHFRPDYVRAHYKIGITYALVLDYPNALKQYMVALSLLAETSRGFEGTLHEDIMKSIKKVVVDMGRPDLLPAVQGQNLEVLSRTCGFQYSNGRRSHLKNNAFRILKHVFSP